MSEKQTQVHKKRPLSTILKVIIIILFVLIGIGILTIGIICLVKYPNDPNCPKWMSICNIVFGACLLVSPFFFSKKREGIARVISVLLVILFVAIAILFIVFGAMGLGLNWYPNAKWYPIIDLVFGCLLLTSPILLK